MNTRLVTLIFALLWSALAQAQVVEYVHTDALGSPVAITNEAGQVIERTDYQPYGTVIGKANNDRPGYTGHVMDSATGLTYMQQRYYDPTTGRFLSTDPIQADGNSGGFFNRYVYANNSPYKFIDLDGRQSHGYGTNLPDKILDCHQTNTCVTLEQADQGVRRDANQLVGLIGTTWVVGGTAGTAVETGTVGAVLRPAGRVIAKKIFCGLLAACGTDPKNVGKPPQPPQSKFENDPEGQIAEDLARMSETLKKMIERLRKSESEIKPPPKPTPPPPPPPPSPPPSSPAP